MINKIIENILFGICYLTIGYMLGYSNFFTLPKSVCCEQEIKELYQLRIDLKACKNESRYLLFELKTRTKGKFYQLLPEGDTIFYMLKHELK